MRTKKRTTEQILRERKRSEKGRNKIRKSLPRVRDSGRRWKDWRTTDGVKNPVVTYRIEEIRSPVGEI